LIIETVLAQNGNVGIGTSNPTAKLDIIGAIKITDGTQGAGKVLTSDASGKASWKTVSLPPSDSTGGYPSVWIGCNAWMTKNLDVSKYRNGDPIPKVTNGATWASLTTGAYCYYQNDSATYAAVYGKLYNWYAVNDPRGLAPEGWHIPSDFEWTYLVNTLGGNNVAGGPMKVMGTLHWTEPNLGATDLCNFSALPGGNRGVQGGFNSEGDFGYWWSSTKGGTDIAWSRKLNYLDTEISGDGSDLNLGYSVRCVRD
jgi:uncharacterized protein (TIGR02145 family)